MSFAADAMLAAVFGVALKAFGERARFLTLPGPGFRQVHLDADFLRQVLRQRIRVWLWLWVWLTFSLRQSVTTKFTSADGAFRRVFVGFEGWGLGEVGRTQQSPSYHTCVYSVYH